MSSNSPFVLDKLFPFAVQKVAVNIFVSCSKISENLKFQLIGTRSQTRTPKNGSYS